MFGSLAKFISLAKRYRGYRWVRQHRSRLARDQAELYTDFLKRARAVAPRRPEADPKLRDAVLQFTDQGFTSFHTPETTQLAKSMFDRIEAAERDGRDIWDDDLRFRGNLYGTFPEIEQLFRGDVGDFFTGVYRSNFKLYYGVLYKSQNVGQAPAGSQLWHSDGGPGTCTNVMFYLRDVEREDGAMEALPWAPTLRIYREEFLGREPAKRVERALQQRAMSPEEQREILCNWYGERIDRRFTGRIAQPTGQAGLVLPFSNNILHKGGYPQAGRTRYVCVFHVYPSDRETPFELYRERGIAKRGAYPKDPAEL